MSVTMVRVRCAGSDAHRASICGNVVSSFLTAALSTFRIRSEVLRLSCVQSSGHSARARHQISWHPLRCRSYA
jgi:hypothetical protein